MNTLISVFVLLTVVKLGYSVEMYNSDQSSVSMKEHSSSNDSNDSSEKDESVSVEEHSSANDSTDSSEKDESVSVEEHSSANDSTDSNEKDESVANDSTDSSEKDESVASDSTDSSEKDVSVANDSTDSSEKDESVSVEEHSSANDSTDLSEADDIDYEDTIILAESIPDCGNDTNMNATIRMAAYSLHIVLRGDLANGQVKNGNCTEVKNFSSASDMSLLTYDCGLEQSAFNISKMCRHESDFNFSNVGSNSAFYAGKIEDVHQLIHEMIYVWWNTSMQGFPLSMATPTASDSGMIPFLQMANANTTKIGCAYSECNSGRDGCDISSSSIVFVCSYGTAHIRPNTPIYTEGRPCDACNNTCAYRSLCNRTMSELECH